MVDETRDFNAATVRKIRDESAVGYVAVCDTRRACLDAVDDEGPVLAAAFCGQRGVRFLELPALLLPGGDLLFAPADVVIEGDLELLDQFGAIIAYEVGAVFGEVFAALCDEIAEAHKHFVANAVPLRNAVVF